MIKKKKGKILISIISIIMITIIGLAIYKNKNELYIDKVLTEKSYSYLPKEAKNYIKNIYQKTGKVILTEKNKKENTPYLNPKYVDYLTLTDDKKEKVEVIPNNYVVDFQDGDVQNETYPSRYNLNSVNNKNYLTPFYNQGNLGICWAFASIEQAESYLMVKNNESYSEQTQRFSARQMDYATSINGIKNYENENAYNRNLTDGGNYYMSQFIMSYGLSLNDYEGYNQAITKKELHEVLNFKNSKYELKSSIILPQISKDATEEQKTAYINTIKKNIIQYGGAYVGTGSPSGYCGFKNTDGTYAIVDRDNCIGTSGHAMQIVGWDDDYTYSYCKSGSKHKSVNQQGKCDSGTLESGTGTWILRNSWGEMQDYKYVYLGYSSYEYEVDFTTSLTSMNDRTWDNIYHKNIWKDGTADTPTDMTVYNKKINTIEKLEEVKFMPASSNGQYKISIQTPSQNYEDIKFFSVDYPGTYTIDLTDKEILLNDQQFTIIISSTNNTSIIANTISAFTSNVSKTPQIETENIDGSKITINQNDNYEFIVYSNTKNINSNETVSYELYKDNIDYSNYLIAYNNNVVAENNINATIILNKNIPVGNYKLRIKYNDYYSETNLSIPTIYNLQGSGTPLDPYLIYNEDDLNQMRYNLDAYYLLKNDITLTKNWIPIGTYNTPFKGGFDGGNHTITGLKIEENNDSAVGLFGYVKVKYYYYQQIPEYFTQNEKTYFKNVKFKDSDVTNRGDASIFIGHLIINTEDKPSNAINERNPQLEIENIHFIDGNLTSTNGNAGVIIGNIDVIPITYDRPYLNINNTYTSITVSGLNSAGFIGYINDQYEAGSGIMLYLTISNFQNTGIIDVKTPNIEYGPFNNYSPVLGGLYGNIKIELNNFIINTIFNDSKYMSQFNLNNDLYFIGYYNEETSESLSYNLSHGYYVGKYNNISTSASSIKDNSLYGSWPSFSDYWKIETIDGIKRIPVMKDIEYNYTDISDISMKKYDKVSLLDYITGKNDYEYIEYSTISNDNIIKIKKEQEDISIEALEKGTATIHVINNYDGLEKDINITVTADKKEKPIITYLYNTDDNNYTYQQQVNKQETFTLSENEFTRAGYTFMGWNTIADGTGINYEDKATIENGIDEDLRLYAIWNLNVYTIKFDPNGGTGTIADLTGATIYMRCQLPLNSFTRENYRFTGWNTKRDGTGISFNNRDIIAKEQLMLFDSVVVTLYAQWESTKGIITFNSNDGYEQIKEQTITLEETTKLNKNTFTREGYIFKEWNTKQDGTGTSYSDEQMVSFDKNTTLYAIWKKDLPYTINKYSVDETNHYISKIMVNTELNNFTSNIILGYGYGIDVDYKTIDNKKILYTGGKTRITHGLDLYQEYTNVVIGDINGDGKINSADLLRIRQHLLGTNILTGVYFLSSDINYDNTINSADLLRIRQHLLGTKPIE